MDNNPEKYRKTFGIEKGKINWDKFLSVLTGDFPQLLVHLYEAFRAVDVASEFHSG